MVSCRCRGVTRLNLLLLNVHILGVYSVKPVLRVHSVSEDRTVLNSVDAGRRDNSARTAIVTDVFEIQGPRGSLRLTSQELLLLRSLDFENRYVSQASCHTR
jgi:hypothetical protein